MHGLRLILIATLGSIACVAGCDSENEPAPATTPEPTPSGEDGPATSDELETEEEEEATPPDIVDLTGESPMFLADRSTGEAQRIAVSWRRDGGLAVWATREAMYSRALGADGTPTGPVHRVPGPAPRFTKFSRMPIHRVRRGYLSAASDRCGGRPCVRVDAFDTTGRPVGSPARARGGLQPHATIDRSDVDGDDMVLLIHHRRDDGAYREMSSLFRFRFDERGPAFVQRWTLADSRRHDQPGPGAVAFDQGRIAVLLEGSFSWCHFEDRHGMPCDLTTAALLLWRDGDLRYVRREQGGIPARPGPVRAEGEVFPGRLDWLQVAWDSDAVVGLINPESGGVIVRFPADGTHEARPATEVPAPAPFDRAQPHIVRFRAEEPFIGAARATWTGRRVGPAVRAGLGYDSPAMAAISHDGDRVVLGWITGGRRRVDARRPALRAFSLDVD